MRNNGEKEERDDDEREYLSSALSRRWGPGKWETEHSLHSWERNEWKGKGHEEKGTRVRCKERSGEDERGTHEESLNTKGIMKRMDGRKNSQQISIKNRCIACFSIHEFPLQRLLNVIRECYVKLFSFAVACLLLWERERERKKEGPRPSIEGEPKNREEWKKWDKKLNGWRGWTRSKRNHSRYFVFLVLWTTRKRETRNEEKWKQGIWFPFCGDESNDRTTAIIIRRIKELCFQVRRTVSQKREEGWRKWIERKLWWKQDWQKFLGISLIIRKDWMNEEEVQVSGRRRLSSFLFLFFFCRCSLSRQETIAAQTAASTESCVTRCAMLTSRDHTSCPSDQRIKEKGEKRKMWPNEIKRMGGMETKGNNRSKIDHWNSLESPGGCAC